jgi:hypothetical protein
MTFDEETSNSQLFENVWQKATAEADALTEDDADRRFLKSLVMGGSVAAESVVSTCQDVREFWGQGSEAAASELNQLFSLVVLSQLYHWLKENPPEGNTSTIPPEVNVMRVVQIFGGDPERGMEDYTHFDKQLECDIKKHGNLTHISILLLARSSEICGHQCMDWSKVKFPVVEMTHLVRGAIIDGAPLRSILDINAMQSCLNAGMQAMSRFYAGEK